jgi:hypothetical protein
MTMKLPALNDSDRSLFSGAQRRIKDSKLPLAVTRIATPAWAAKSSDPWFSVHCTAIDHATLCPSAKEMSAFMVGFQLAFGLKK